MWLTREERRTFSERRRDEKKGGGRRNERGEEGEERRGEVVEREKAQKRTRVMLRIGRWQKMRTTIGREEKRGGKRMGTE